LRRSPSGGHRLFGVIGRHDSKQVALQAAAGNDGGLAVVAAFESAGFKVKAKAGLLLVGAVALEALLLEDRLDVVVEIGGCGGGANGCGA
jgi:hypothetical protein